MRCKPANSCLTTNDVIVHRLRINYGMKDKNPVDSVKFFADWSSVESFNVPREKVSALIPFRFAEDYVRLFVRNPREGNKLAEARAAFDEWARRNKCVSPNPAFRALGSSQQWDEKFDELPPSQESCKCSRLCLCADEKMLMTCTSWRWIFPCQTSSQNFGYFHTPTGITRRFCDSITLGQQ